MEEKKEPKVGVGRGRGRRGGRHGEQNEFQRIPEIVRVPAPVGPKPSEVYAQRSENLPSTSLAALERDRSTISRMSSMRGRCSQVARMDRTDGDVLDVLRNVEIKDDQVLTALRTKEYKSHSLLLNPPLPVVNKIELPLKFGSSQNLHTNHCALTSTQELQAAVYDISFNPADLPENEKKKALKLCVDFPQPSVYLGKGKVYLLGDVGQKLVLKVNEMLVDIILTLVHKMDLNSTPTSELYSVYDSVLSHAMRYLDLTPTKAGYVDFNNKTDIKDSAVSVFEGVDVSLRRFGRDVLGEAEGRLHLVIQPKHKIIGLTSVLDWLNGKTGKLFTNLRNKDEVDSSLVGKFCLSSYNNLEYKILKVRRDMSPKSSFLRCGNEVTFAQYLKDHHQITIKDANQPLLEVRREVSYYHRLKKPEGPTMLVPELCVLTGIPDAITRNFQAMKLIKNKIILQPKSAQQRVCEFINYLANNEKACEYLGSWGLVISKTTEETTGYCLTGEILKGRCGYQIPTSAYAWDNAWKNDKVGVSKPADMKKWLILSPNNARSEVADLETALTSIGKRLGIHVAESEKRFISNRSPSGKDYLAALKGAELMSVNFVFIILPNDDERTYRDLKRFLTAEVGVASQCSKLKTLQGKARLPSIATKILLQIQAKIGGIPWSLDIPIASGILVVGVETSFRSEYRTTARQGVGAVVSHGFARKPSDPQNRREQVFGAETFSLPADENYLSKGSYAAARVAECVEKVVRQYELQFGYYPPKVLIYRSGVADSQFNFLQEAEFEVVKTRLRSYYPEEKVPLAYICVQSNPSSMLFQPIAGDVQFVNPKVGTVVDDDITFPDRSDFYLVSDTGLGRTVTPTYYAIIGFSNFEVQPYRLHRLTFKLCHLYFNWNGPTMLPSVLMNCRRLNHICGAVLQQSTAAPPATIHPNIVHTQFYL